MKEWSCCFLGVECRSHFVMAINPQREESKWSVYLGLTPRRKEDFIPTQEIWKQWVLPERNFTHKNSKFFQSKLLKHSLGTNKHKCLNQLSYFSKQERQSLNQDINSCGGSINIFFLLQGFQWAFLWASSTMHNTFQGLTVTLVTLLDICFLKSFELDIYWTLSIN